MWHIPVNPINQSVTPNWPTPARQGEAAGRQVNTMMFERINVPNKFPFGPSQEDEGRKKTAYTMEIACLIQYHVCSIHVRPPQ